MSSAQKGWCAIGSVVVVVILLLSTWLGDVGAGVGTRLRITAVIVACWFGAVAVLMGDV